MALRTTLATVAALGGLLAGCYGNLSIGIGANDDPPSVSLAATPTSASAGALLSLVAAATDDYAVREVQFFRVDAGGSTLLGRDTTAPYALDTTMPVGSGSVRFFARAVDDVGQQADSVDVVVARP